MLVDFLKNGFFLLAAFTLVHQPNNFVILWRSHRPTRQGAKNGVPI
ncbi:MAG: hypothetical protein ACI8P3_002559 [Saprospiraceae bacterium]|jgi:hypothetical protein